MFRIEGVPRDYKWGSTSRIPRFLGSEPQSEPLAELWFGAHALGPSPTALGPNLHQLIEADPADVLGPSNRFMFGDTLPYLVKLIAPAAALSLQVHPTKREAEAGYALEDRLGIDLEAPNRTYRDVNHKPELLYALTDFSLLAGFAVRRQARERLEGLSTSLASKLSVRLRLAAGRTVKPVVTWLLDPDSSPGPEAIEEFAQACQDRLDAGRSPLPRLDATVRALATAYPGDPGVIVAFLMNQTQLKPGEAVFLPPGTLHSYQSGLGLEVLANSDNVIRAGLTPKHIDRVSLIEIGEFSAHPTLRIAPEHPSPGISRFYAPVEDFELTIIELSGETLPLVGSGPRLVMSLAGSPTVMTREGELQLERGECALLTSAEGPALTSGSGKLAQIAVP